MAENKTIPERKPNGKQTFRDDVKIGKENLKQVVGEKNIEADNKRKTKPSKTETNKNDTKNDKNIASKRRDISFQGKDYNLVLEEYQRLKNIRLQGEEFKPIKQSIKTMFLSSRTSEQIVGCMEWLENNEFYKDKWTINTVAKKLPEFVAGKLDKSKDLYVN